MRRFGRYEEVWEEMRTIGNGRLYDRREVTDKK
jgi:hypothetical protein